MINQFMMDLKKEQSMSPCPPESQPSFTGYHLYNNGNTHHTISLSSDGVLDLSRRRDSVETRKTPSPYNTSSSYGSPSTHISSNSPSVGAITTAAVPREPLAISHPNLTLERTFVPEDAMVPKSPAAYPIFYPTAKRNRSPSPEKVTSNYQTPLGDYPNLQIPLALLSKMTPSAVKPPNAPTASELADETSSDVSINVISNRSPSSTNSGHHASKSVGRDGKPIPRPFKAYPRDPLTIAASFSATDALSAEKYNIFRKRMLEQIHAANGGQPTVSNPKMRRTSSLNSLNEPTTTESQMNYSSSNEESLIPDSNSKVSACTSSNGNNNSLSPTNQNGLIKDAAYYERRRKNNAAAKKSRDRRRIKEDEIAIRAAFLERENIELKFELAAARKQLTLYGVTTTS